ncbi:hypothetical protein AWZ03_007027 [Drosophila navojoa]|uniref:Uncharacterized protein n=1 Tax=Drosophila navojoa TaxID=7232 RepID=A0A484BCZ8_DRONA|nr:uncharacterized protein LOC115562697 isoform X1 [Drosophila navojoa]XP_030240518.1 uncharacterized protein LOC115562697 isoform X1 [Drosophila navojoa]XP_030240519.1 uncharacterized protein LOC115562697 isoform X1 [Drosophila navojoa]XP_030240520.1 uncharacterized protein LOC115562697 isoform X1 [Drosophila navojoa]TDG46589.1 hypothetical protein AWZ03_007027 [Drosophila navojoa]
MANVGGLDYGDKLPAIGGVTSSTALAIRNSTIIAHRLSIYLPQLLLPTRDPQKLIMEINCYVAQFRELLIFIGQSRDSPELREKIRRLRRSCVDACKHTAHLITPQPKHCQGSASGNLNLSLLYQLTQQFRHELLKSHRLIQLVPYDMTDYYAPARTAPSNLGNVISQILLCKQINPDFQQEELCSISKDAQELYELLDELKPHLPSPETGNEADLYEQLPHSSAAAAADVNLAFLNSPPAWYKQQRRRSCRTRSRSLCLCCCLKSSQVNSF